MREIKFRAWNADGEMWEDSEDLVFSIGLQELVAVDHGITYWKCRHIKLEQYTGLKDKNGTEIYEGDVLATSNNNPEFDIWKEGDNGYAVAKWIGTGFYICCDDLVWDLDEEDSIYNKTFVRIIGNIHENPELLHE